MMPEIPFTHLFFYSGQSMMKHGKTVRFDWFVTSMNARFDTLSKCYIIEH